MWVAVQRTSVWGIKRYGRRLMKPGKSEEGTVTRREEEFTEGRTKRLALQQASKNDPNICRQRIRAGELLGTLVGQTHEVMLSLGLQWVQLIQPTHLFSPVG